MRFRRVPLRQARGHILGHNVAHEGRRVLKKGRRVSELELEELAESGVSTVYVAELDARDVGEDAAAQRIGSALAEYAGLRLALAHGGRASLLAPSRGVLSIQPELLLELNLVEGVTLATPHNHQLVASGQHVGTLKIIPFALPESHVLAALGLVERGLLRFRALEPRRVCILVSGAESRRERLLETYRPPLEARLTELGSSDVSVEYLQLDAEAEATLAAAIVKQCALGVQLLLVVGETATMDKDDLIPRAIRGAGGEVHAVGAPVFPGNLLLVGYRGAVSILGAPGCARSRAQNVVDLLLPRLLSGERPGQREIAELGLGGLLQSSARAWAEPEGSDHD
jgi:molybdenum cofactor cytidylyltransferase